MAGNSPDEKSSSHICLYLAQEPVSSWSSEYLKVVTIQSGQLSPSFKSILDRPWRAVRNILNYREESSESEEDF